jgi:anaerobic magnesium-protoporphyrin IX monomethyl ester cyclase
MMRILFINPNTRYLNALLTVFPPQGILYISAVLLKNGFDIKVIDADIENLSHEDILSVIRDFHPHIIGITMNTLQTHAVYILAEFIKQKENIPIVVGGPHPSAVKETVLKQCDFIDFVIYGEGENTFLELAKTLMNNGSIESVDGIVFKYQGSIKINKPRLLISNLDDIPFPALELLGSSLKKYPGAYPVGAQPSIQIMASRGCPFKCSFCSNPVWGKKTRFRSPESVLLEIDWLQKNFGIREIFFVDDTFNLNRGWFEAICNGIISRKLNKKLIFKSPFRVNQNLVDENLLHLARQAGFWMIFFGVESGSQRVLDEVNKNIRLQEIERAFKLTKKAGLRTYASFIIGHLSDTKDSIADTITFAKKIDPDFFGFAIAMPWPGSEMYTVAKNKGYLLSDCEEYVLDKYLMRTENFQPDELIILHQHAVDSLAKYRNSFCYKFKKFIFKIVFNELDSITSDYIPFQGTENYLENFILMGHNEKGVLGEGWWSLENWPPMIRWTKKRAIGYLKADTKKKLHITLFTGIPNQKVIIIANDISKKFSLLANTWTTVEMDINNSCRENVIRVVIETQLWIPKNILKTDDDRQIGVAVEKIWLT